VSALQQSVVSVDSFRKINPILGVPQEDIGKSFRYSKSKPSDPSVSLVETNIPEVSDLVLDFTYNFYKVDERIAPSPRNDLPLSKNPRYVTLKWTAPPISSPEIIQDNSKQTRQNILSIEANKDKIISEDNFFNPGYINHTFSNVDAIEQGSTDLENYSRITRNDAESLSKMAKYQIQETASTSDSRDDTQFQTYMNELSETYTKLVDFPQSSLGLRVYDEDGTPNDKDDLLRSLTRSLSLSVKINSLVAPDIFKDSPEKKNEDTLENIQVSYSEGLSNLGRTSNKQRIDPVISQCFKLTTPSLTQPTRLLGYVVDRYVLSNESTFKKDNTFYVEDIQNTSLVDNTVLYGKTYVYSVRTVASTNILTYDDSGTIVEVSTVYVSSRPISTPVECYEHTPPPAPNDIKFIFDYNKRNLRIYWDTPVNPQVDIKQFQVFRRKTIKEPFELIAQYGFDTSKYGPGEDGRYKTGERVDANNIDNMLPEDKFLVHAQSPDETTSRPVYLHVDEDFTVDTEFFVSSQYIYAFCSIDAHGMISNYSSQHHVTFDPYKNRLVTKVVCDSGAPRQYPNMTLKLDAFKDVISVSGNNSRQLQVFFTPEYLKVKDERNRTYKIVEAQTSVNSSPYYLLQLINLDNQKTNLLRIDVKDSTNLTV
jgi:hypothetical protein